MKNTIMKDTIILTVITLVSGFLLGLVNHITEEPIAHQQQLAKEEAYAAVFEDADSFEGVSVETDLQEYVNAQGYEAQTIDEIMEAKDASGETLGYVMTVTSSEGYGGDIQFAMGVQEDGTMNGISILSISETAGWWSSYPLHEGWMTREISRSCSLSSLLFLFPHGQNHFPHRFNGLG